MSWTSVWWRSRIRRTTRTRVSKPYPCTVQGYGFFCTLELVVVRVTVMEQGKKDCILPQNAEICVFFVKI